MAKSFLETITNYLEVDGHEEVNFKGKALTFYIKISKNLKIANFLMTFQNFKTKSFCVGGRHRSATTFIVGDITVKKARKEVNLLAGQFLICNRKNL